MSEYVYVNLCVCNVYVCLCKCHLIANLMFQLEEGEAPMCVNHASYTWPHSFVSS